MSAKEMYFKSVTLQNPKLTLRKLDERKTRKK